MKHYVPLIFLGIPVRYEAQKEVRRQGALRPEAMKCFAFKSQYTPPGCRVQSSSKFQYHLVGE